MEWLYKASDPILETLGACLLLFIFVIVITRLIGLRSFAKFTTYDFAFTVASGSIISSILTSSTSILHGCTAITGLLTLTLIFSVLQRKYELLNKTISNKPILLMEGPEILYENLKNARIHKEQLIAKLREANVLNYDQVYAVVLEATGDISVLHKSSAEGEKFEERMLEGVSQ